jgi:AraC family transcriptional regulator of adaptative response/methylated-DNA-[protein]-cysteine methyltransferase
MSDYDRIAAAIDFLECHQEAQPGLAEVAAHVSLSPSHFQRLFSRWAGLSPKRFLQLLTLERAKRLLRSAETAQLAISDQLGLSSGSRLYDHFVQLDGVTPSEFRHFGRGLIIRHGVIESPFGTALLAFTDRGICRLSFTAGDRARQLVAALAREWPGAELVADSAGAANIASQAFRLKNPLDVPLSVFVRGTNFQINVWRALLNIPAARFASYGDVAAAVGRPNAARAVGAAIAANPVAFLIPCHRVIRANGELGGYRWGTRRKCVIQAWETARADT